MQGDDVPGEVYDEVARERDRYAHLLRRIEHRLGLDAGPGVSGLGGQLGDETAARRVEKWLDEA